MSVDEDQEGTQEIVHWSNTPVPTSAGTDVCDESDSGLLPTGLTGLSTSAFKRPDDDPPPPELSGRSPAILKIYFSDAFFQLPEGHPTVAFTESQMYHLLRVLSDETLRKSYTTMELMVIDAVKGDPTTDPS